MMKSTKKPLVLLLLFCLLLLSPHLAHADRIFYDDTSGLGLYSLYNLTYVNVTSDVCIDGGTCLSNVSGGTGGGNISSISSGDQYIEVSGTSAVTLSFNESELVSNDFRKLDQNLNTTSIVSFATINTGLGATEVYPMNQAVRTSDSVTFSELGAALNWTYLQNYPVGCSAGEFVRTIGDTLTCAADSDTNLSESDVIGFVNTTDTYVFSTTGNAATATALAANGANCAAGNYPLGVDASGAVEGCTADQDTTYSDLSEFTDSTNIYQEDIGADCSPGNFVKGVDNDGTLDCDAPAGSGDITAVNTNGDYLTVGAASDDVSLLLDESVLNATIDARDSDTTYTAGGTLLDLSGTVFSVNEGTLTNGLGCRFVTGTGLVCDQSYSTTTGTVTSVAAGNGMSFTSITGSGSVTLGTPSTLTGSTSNALTATSHTHAIDESGFSIAASQITSGTFGAGNYVFTGGTLDAPTLNTGQGDYELYAMNQDVESTDAVTFSTVNTGQGANELYAMNQDVESTDAVTFVTVNTGQGANELYDMNQNVQTTDDVVFSSVIVGSLNLSTDSANHHIVDNSTCVIISGDTSVFEVC